MLFCCSCIGLQVRLLGRGSRAQQSDFYRSMLSRAGQGFSIGVCTIGPILQHVNTEQPIKLQVHDITSQLDASTARMGAQVRTWICSYCLECCLPRQVCTCMIQVSQALLALLAEKTGPEGGASSMVLSDRGPSSTSSDPERHQQLCT